MWINYGGGRLMRSITNKELSLFDFPSVEVEQKINDKQKSPTHIFKLNSRSSVFGINRLKNAKKKDLLQHIIQHEKSF